MSDGSTQPSIVGKSRTTESDRHASRGLGARRFWSKMRQFLLKPKPPESRNDPPFPLGFRP